MEGLRRVRWTNLGRVAAVVGAGVVIVAVGPGVLERPKPPPLAENIGLAGAAKPSNRAGIGALRVHSTHKATNTEDLAAKRRMDANGRRGGGRGADDHLPHRGRHPHSPRRIRSSPDHQKRPERNATPAPT